jgi:hypothetical protein
VISKRLGPASIRTTYDVCGHLFEGRDREAADRLEGSGSRSSDGPQMDTRRTPDGQRVLYIDA